MKKILAYGEIVWDVYPDKAVIGGAPLNFSAHAALCGAESVLISAVGQDPLGTDALQTLKKFGVKTQYLKTTAEPTGQCIVTLDERFVPQYDVLRNVAYDHIRLTEDDLTEIDREHFDTLYFGTLVQRESVSRQTLEILVKRCHFSNIFCDINLRKDCYDESTVRFCLSHADILKISAEEEPLLRQMGLYKIDTEKIETIARKISNTYRQIKTIIITLGKDGSYAYIPADGSDYYQNSVGDTVVSTVGAGDSFSAAWLVHYLNGESIDVCMKKAAERSGYVVAHQEAIPVDD